MSSVAFHSITRTAKVGGAERAIMDQYLRRALGIALPFHGMCVDLGMKHVRSKVIGPRHLPMPDDKAPPQEWDRYAESLEMSLGHGREPVFQHDGKPVNSFGLYLNTAMTIGGDGLRFASRIHGQCEVHAWVDGPNRAWLADMIERLLSLNVLRRNPHQTQYGNWPDVMALLRESSEGEVVTSYSVCDSFPSRHLIETPKDADEDGEWFYGMPHEERWTRCMKALREKGGGLEMRPDDWEVFRFDAGVSMFDIVADDSASRLAVEERRR